MEMNAKSSDPPMTLKRRGLLHRLESSEADFLEKLTIADVKSATFSVGMATDGRAYAYLTAEIIAGGGVEEYTIALDPALAIAQAIEHQTGIRERNPDVDAKHAWFIARAYWFMELIREVAERQQVVSEYERERQQWRRASADILPDKDFRHTIRSGPEFQQTEPR